MTEPSDLIWLSATELAVAYRQRQISPVEVVDAVLDRLAAAEPSVNAFVTVTADDARREAREAERKFARGDEGGPLAGVPITVKDLTNTAGVRTTYGSSLHSANVPEQDDIDWARLKEAGAILVGKTTTPEFGLLGVTESQLTGITNNPWDVTRTTGGSSGGAAASLASGVAPLAWGSDGGGSIRVPAAFCGVVGLKVSEGRIPSRSSASYQGVSTSGPLARTVTDVALALSITAGPDVADPGSLPWADPTTFTTAAARASVEGLRIAVAPHFGRGPVSRDVQAGLTRAVSVLGSLGAVTSDVVMELPDPIDYFLDFWSPSFAVAIDDLRALPGWADDRVHPTMLKLAERGNSLSAVHYWNTSVVVRQRIYEGFSSVFADHDLIVVPTVPLTAFAHPGPAAGNADVDGIPVSHPALDFHRLTEPPSHAGLPAITVPCGADPHGLPIGMQIIGPRFADALVLQAAAAFEAATPWCQRHPSL